MINPTHVSIPYVLAMVGCSERTIRRAIAARKLFPGREETLKAGSSRFAYAELLRWQTDRLGADRYKYLPVTDGGGGLRALQDYMKTLVIQRIAEDLNHGNKGDK